MKEMSSFRALRRSLRHRIASDVLGRVRPTKLRLAVTNRCTARCIMCNVWEAGMGSELRAKELRLEEYEKIFTHSAPMLSALSHVSLTGGEPTLRQDLIDILKIVVRHHPTVSLNLNTNAFNTKGLVAFAEQAAEVTPRLTVMISLDGLGEGHDLVRGLPGVYEKTLRSIETLLEMKREGVKINVGLNHCLTRVNYTEFERVQEFAAERSVEVTPIMLQEGEFFQNEGMDLSLTEEATAHLRGVFERLITEPKTRTLKNIEILEQLRGQGRDYRCWAGNVIFLIEEHGEVYPNGGCPTEWNLGNLRDHDYRLQNILKTEQARGVRDQVAKCRRCRLACETLTTLRGPEAMAGRRKLITA